MRLARTHSSCVPIQKCNVSIFFAADEDYSARPSAENQPTTRHELHRLRVGLKQENFRWDPMRLLHRRRSQQQLDLSNRSRVLYPKHSSRRAHLWMGPCFHRAHSALRTNSLPPFSASTLLESPSSELSSVHQQSRSLDRQDLILRQAFIESRQCVESQNFHRNDPSKNAPNAGVHSLPFYHLVAEGFGTCWSIRMGFPSGSTSVI